MTLIPDEEFEKVAAIKGAVAHIIKEHCRDGGGTWLVQEESIYPMTILVRRLDKDSRQYLEDDLKNFASRESGVSISAFRYGITCSQDHNKEMRIEVKIKPPGKR